MPGEERRQHVRMPTFYAKKPGVQSEMKRGVRDIPTTSYSYNSISRYAYRGISAHIPRRDLVIFCVLRSH